MSDAATSNVIINRERLLERFIRYAKVDSAADPSSTEYPSSKGQLILGKMLVEELLAMGVRGACQDEHGLVWASLPSNAGEDAPTLALVAHMDTSPEAPSENVQPQVVRSYLNI